MKRGLDTNVLINALLPGLPDHRTVRRYLIRQLRQPEVTLILTPGIVHELLHIITDARRFDPPVPMPRALALAHTEPFPGDRFEDRQYKVHWP